jgi:hypothetical protein
MNILRQDESRMNVLRQDESRILASFLNTASDKVSINEELQQMLANEKTLALRVARRARKAGLLKRATHDLYENVATKDFWKINSADGTIERVVNVADNGFVKE